MKKFSSFCNVLIVILFIAGSIFINKGFDKKDNYYNSDIYSSINKNNYVGGDAYNYIINANYFTGYIVLGCSLYVCATILSALSAYIIIKEQERAQIINSTSTNLSANNVIDNLPPL